MGSLFLPLVAALLAGISVAVTGGGSILANSSLVAALVASARCLRHRGSAARVYLGLILAVPAGLWLGWRASVPSFGPLHVARLAGPRPVRVVGQVLSVERGSRKTKVEVDALRSGPAGGERAARGRILLTIARSSGAPQAGCLIAFSARLRRPRNFGNPGGFDYEGFLARRGIFVTAFLWDDRGVERLGCTRTWLSRLLRGWRGRVKEAIRSSAGRAEAGVLEALVLGDRQKIPGDVKESMVRSGVAHTLAISGLHVGVVFGAAYWLIGWLLSRSERALLATDVKTLSAALALGPTLAYALLAGGRVSTWRALIMLGAFVGAAIAGRPATVIRALALAAAILVIINPLLLLDVSFQLSFVAVLGIVVAAGRVASGAAGSVKGRREQRPGSRVARLALSSFLVSLAATLATAPITATRFQRVSLVAPVTNLFVLPFLGPGAVVPAVAAAFLLPLSRGAARLLLSLAAWSVGVGLALARFFAGLPFASWSSFVPTEPEILLYYGWAGLFLGRRALGRRPLVAALLLCFLGTLLDGGFWLWRRHFDHRLHVTFLSVGQGEAAVVEFPGGRVMAVDGGPRYSSGFDTGERVVAPFLRSRKIMRLDYLVMTHAQMDHCGGLPALIRGFEPGEIWWNGADERGCLAGVTDYLKVRGTKLVRVRRGIARTIGGVTVLICHPPANLRPAGANDRSVVLRLVHGRVSLALTGDIEAVAERSLVESGCLDQSTILKVPHHGSTTSSTSGFVEAVSPQVAVFSVGRSNRFGFPRPEVVSRYRKLGTRLLRTDLQGAVEISSDGLSYFFCVGRRVRACRLGGGPPGGVIHRRVPSGRASPPRS